MTPEYAWDIEARRLVWSFIHGRIYFDPAERRVMAEAGYAEFLA